MKEQSEFESHAQFFGLVPKFVTVIILLSIASAIFIFPERLNWDVAQLLHEGMLLSQGKLPYVDFNEINPPLIIYLSSLPAIISVATKIKYFLVVQILFVILIIWSVLSVNSILKQTYGTGKSFESNFLVAVWAAFSLWVLFRMEIGQREHLFVMLYVPYLLLRHFKWHGYVFSNYKCVSFGVAAAIGACLKPHFLFISILPEFYWFLTIRQWKKLFQAETIAFFLAGLVYAVHFIFLPDIMLNEYFKKILFAWKHFHAFNCSVPDLLTKNSIIFSVAVLTISFLIGKKNGEGMWLLVRPLSVLITGSCFMFILQRKGYGYQSIPAQAFCALLVGIVAGDYCATLVRKESFPQKFFYTRFDRKWKKNILLYFVPFLGMAAIVLSIRNVLILQHDQLLVQNSLSRAINKYSLEGEPILVISTFVPDIYPTVLLMECQQGSRHLVTSQFAFFSPLYSDPGRNYSMYWSKDGSSLPDMLFLQELETDISTFRPKLIVISKNCFGCVSGFDIMEFLSKIGFIERAMADYKLVSEDFSRFTLFYRITGN